VFSGVNVEGSCYSVTAEHALERQLDT